LFASAEMEELRFQGCDSVHINLDNVFASITEAFDYCVEPAL
jgi:hypothetical protein